MARARSGALVQSKIQMILFGRHFTGKSTMALQLAYFKNPDGTPFKILYLDPETGSIDDFMTGLQANGIDLRNIYIVYTQSLTECREYIQKAKNNEDYYVLDEDGNETDQIVLDGAGNPFRPDAIVVDGSTILNLTTKHGLVNLSKKRAKVKAERDGIVGDEKFVKVQSAFLELKDYQLVNFEGQDLILDLNGSGKHYIVTARETDEKVTREIGGKEVSVITGRKIPDGFKGMDYNAKTVVRMFRDEDDYSIVKAFVEKDRTGVHKGGEVLEDPSLLDWQVVIDKTAGEQVFIVKNNLHAAVKTEMKKMEQVSFGQDLDKSPGNDSVAEIRNQINGLLKGLDPVKKAAVKKGLENRNLPTAISKEKDAGVLKKILEAIKSEITNAA